MLSSDAHNKYHSKSLSAPSENSGLEEEGKKHLSAHRSSKNLQYLNQDPKIGREMDLSSSLSALIFPPFQAWFTQIHIAITSATPNFTFFTTKTLLSRKGEKRLQLPQFHPSSFLIMKNNVLQQFKIPLENF